MLEFSSINIALRFDAYWEPSPGHIVETIVTHNDVIRSSNSVWWGKFGSGSSKQKLDLLQSQIKDNIETYVYLFTNSPYDKCYVAKLLGITDNFNKVEEDLIPHYYRREAKSYSLFFKFNYFREVSRYEALNNLRLASKPNVADSLENAFRGSTSRFYVISHDKDIENKILGLDQD